MAEWKKVKIGDFLKRSKIPIDIKNDQEYKRVTIRIKHNGVSLRDKIIGKKIGTKKQFILKAGQFILSKIDARYGAFGIAPKEVDGAIITGNFWAYDIDETLTSADWINNYTNSNEFYEICERASSGITHRKYLDEDIFLNHELYLPLVNEQIIIIRRFDMLKNQICNLSNFISKDEDSINELRQTVLQEAIEGKLTEEWRKLNPELINGENHVSILLEKIKSEKERLIKEGKIKKDAPFARIIEDKKSFDLPEGWVWCRLGDIVQIRGGKRVTNGYKLLKTLTPYIYIRVSDMKNGSIDDSDLHYIDEKMYQKIKQYTISKNDLYMTIVGGTIGKCGIVPDKFDNMNLTENAAKIVIFKFNKDYLLNCLKSNFCQNQFIDKTKQVGVQKMALNRLATTSIPFPSLAEQKTIVERVCKLMLTIDELEKQISERKDNSESLMRSVLREAFAE